MYLVARSLPGAVHVAALEDQHIALVMKILFIVSYADKSMSKEEVAVTIKGHENTLAACQRLRGVYDNVPLAEELPFEFLNRYLLSPILSDDTKMWIVRLINALLGPMLDVEVSSPCSFLK